MRRDFQAMIDRADEGSAVGEPLLACADRLLMSWKRVRDGTLLRGEFHRFHLLAVQRQMEELLGGGGARP